MYAHSDTTSTGSRRTVDDTAARWFCARGVEGERPAEAGPAQAALGLGVLARDSADVRSAARLARGAWAGGRQGLECSVTADRSTCPSGEEVTLAVVVANAGLTPCRATARLALWQQTGGGSRQLRSYLLRLELRAGAVYRAIIRHTVIAHEGAALGATLSVYDEMERLQTMDEAAFATAPANSPVSETRRAA